MDRREKLAWRKPPALQQPYQASRSLPLRNGMLRAWAFRPDPIYQSGPQNGTRRRLAPQVEVYQKIK